MENERLKLRLAELKALQHQQRMTASTASSSSSGLNVILSSSTAEGAQPGFTHVFGRVNMGEDGTMSPTILSASDFAAGDADDEEGGRKKKVGSSVFLSNACVEHPSLPS